MRELGGWVVLGWAPAERTVFPSLCTHAYACLAAMLILGPYGFLGGAKTHGRPLHDVLAFFDRSSRRTIPLHRSLSTKARSCSFARKVDRHVILWNPSEDIRLGYPKEKKGSMRRRTMGRGPGRDAGMIKF